jgi:hypothetical protein
LYRAVAGNKRYINFRPNQLKRGPITIQAYWRVDASTEYMTNLVVVPAVTAGISNAIILDPWGKPINFYNTRPLRPTVTGTWGYPTNATVGGQVNLQSIDLMSYGPDMVTFAPSLQGPYAVTNAALDDITNFPQ